MNGTPNNRNALRASIARPRFIAKTVAFWCGIISLSGLLAASAVAAEVRIGLSSQKAYVGIPVVLQIQFSDASKYERPKVPEVDGLQIEAIDAPSLTIINGRRAGRTTITFSYRITPIREGSFTIPPITVIADAQQQQTQPIQLVALTSETGDLLFVDVQGERDQVYVGQPLKLTLRIWVKPYRDEQHDITLPESHMWRLISDQTQWGPFANRLEEMAAQNRRPSGRDVLRTDGNGNDGNGNDGNGNDGNGNDGNGNQLNYYQYDIETTAYPRRPGQLDVEDVRIVVQYPTSLGRSRDPFSSLFGDNAFPFSRSLSANGDFNSPFGARIQVRSIRPIVGEATVDPITVKPIPTAGRPTDYRGAVGQYRILTEARPTRVKAGDPIQLNLGIAGTGPMDLVQAPPLAEWPPLTSDFKVPDEPLAGFVQGDSKGFSTSIRPRRAGLTQIPSIPFSYFDPDQEQFVTVRSQPISIQVDPADMLALDAIVSHDQQSGLDTDDSPGNSHAHPLPNLTNQEGPRVLANQTRPATIPWPLWILLATPPLLVITLCLTQFLPACNRILKRLKSPVRECQSRLAHAEHPTEIASALQHMFARCFESSQDSATPATAVGQLRTAGYRDLAIRFQRIFDQCEKSTATATVEATESLELLKADAIQTVSDWDTRTRSPREQQLTPPRSRFRRGPAATRLLASPSRRGTLKSAALGALLVVALAPLPLMTALFPASSLQGNTLTAVNPTALNLEQQTLLLQEAHDLYQLATNSASRDAADAKQAYSQAADKYQLLVDSGIRNGRLYANLANAHLQGGQLGLAIANYHRALRWEPTNRSFRSNLQYAQRLAESSRLGSAKPRARGSFRDRMAQANQWLNGYLAPASVLALFVAAWCVLWGTIGWRLVQPKLAWKTLAGVALLICTTSAISFRLSCQSTRAENAAVLLARTADLRAGDGDQFPVLTAMQGTLGTTVQILARRGEWVRVQFPAGPAGWLPKSVVEPI